MAMADLLRFAQALPLLLLITTSVSKLGVACENVEESGQPRPAPQARNLDHHPLGGPNSTSSLQDPLLSGLGRIPEKGSREYLALFLEETQWYNDLVLGPWMPAKWRQALPHVLESWLRNYVAGLFVYFATGGLWCLYVYYLKGDVYFPAGGIPSKEPVLLQIYVTMQAMPMYSGLPTVSEYMIERGWTRCYARVEEVGLLRYAALCTAYLIFIEFGIYWMHRLLHDIKPLYKSLHATHHIYNKQNTLSPFAGLAFHPLDGILQAAPHVVALFMIPTHLFTHELLMFLEGVWTTNIHDCIDGQVWGVMGAGYHTIHHTTYRHNYGHYTVWMDWMFGTLRDPIERLAAAKQS